MDDVDVSALKTLQRLLRKKIGDGLKVRREALKAQVRKPAEKPAISGETEPTEKGDSDA